MQRVGRNHLTFIDSSSFKLLADQPKRISLGELYQKTLLQLLASFEAKKNVSSLTDQVVSLAERAYAAQHYEFLGLAGKALLGMAATPKNQNLGLYYYALHLNKGGRGDLQRATPLFEQVASEASLPFRAKAMLGLGRNAYLGPHPETARWYYREAARLLSMGDTFDPVTTIVTGKCIAVLKSWEGDHRGALVDLESLRPIARLAGLSQPAPYYEYLNSLAVEWAEAGRLAEARHISEITNASPYVSIYSDWRETLDEIRLKALRPSRSVMPVPHIPSEVRDSPTQIVSWRAGPVREDDSGPRRWTSSARIINLQDWKKKLDKKSNGNTQKKPSLEQIRAMTLEEKQATITRCVYSDEVTEEMLDSILKVTLGSETGERDQV
ncbi:MAG: hypothetical protein AABO41_19135 [Acidobacteriota bacterium]